MSSVTVVAFVTMILVALAASMVRALRPLETAVSGALSDSADSPLFPNAHPDARRLPWLAVPGRAQPREVPASSISG